MPKSKSVSVATVVDNQVLTQEEVAERLSVSRRQIIRWCDERKIPFIQLPYGRRIRLSDLNAWLEENKVEPA